MKPVWRLAIYGVGLVVAFAASFGLAHVLVPNDVVDHWVEQSDSPAANH